MNLSETAKTILDEWRKDPECLTTRLKILRQTNPEQVDLAFTVSQRLGMGQDAETRRRIENAVALTTVILLTGAPV